MAHHGALCFGKDSEEAFQVANSLEKVCTDYILENAKSKLGLKADNLNDFCSEIVGKLTKSEKTVEIDNSMLYNSTCNRENGQIVFTNKADGSEFSMELNGAASDVGELAKITVAHKDIYEANPKFNNIIHNTSSEVVAVSKLGKTVKPLLDDFAQICGTKVKCVATEKAAKAIKGKNAVLIKGQGALCCGSDEGDAQAVDMIMSKQSLTLLGSKALGKAKAINPVESALMRVVYLMKYSKQASK
jgi:L-fuculose-phosphate aldolase